MAEIRVRLSRPAALAVAGAILLVLAIWPSDFRRGPMLEVRGFFGMAPRYEPLYRDCAVPNENRPRLDAMGVLMGMARANGPRFFAADDVDALQFARAARPDCRLAVLYRVKRGVFNRRNYPSNLERVY